jgi:ATP-dependent Clp protease adaptor protein ClpS
MLQIHRSGLGVAGVYVLEVAETKAATVHRLAEEQGYPLRAGVEKE